MLPSATMKVSRDDLLQVITYALWRHFKFRQKRRSVEEHRPYANRVVEHLEMCGVELEKREQRKLHSGP